MKRTPIQNSARLFSVALTSGNTIYKLNFSLSDLATDTGDHSGTEMFYSLHEQIDSVLDLKEGESITFKPNRDNPKDNAILLRTT